MKKEKLKVIVSSIAQIQFIAIRAYISENWPVSVLFDFDEKTEEKIDQVSEFPKSCPVSKKKKDIFEAVIEEHNSFYYRINKNQIEILIFVDNRMDPKYSNAQIKKFGK